MIRDVFPFISKLPAEEGERIVRSIVTKRFQAGELVNRAEEGCAGLMAVESGQLRICTSSEEGREITLFRVNSGEICILSLACLLDGIAFEVEIEAAEETAVKVIPAAVLRGMEEKNPEAGLFLYKSAVEKFSEVMWTMQQLLFMRLDRRIAIYLWEEVNRRKETELRLTHEMIARQIGSSREAVTRIMKYFEEEKILCLRRGRVFVADKNKLRAAAYPPV